MEYAGASKREAPAGFIEYRNQRYGFSLLLPQDLHVDTFDEGSGASTITFENIGGPDGGARGFQIFVVPHGAAQVGEQRFRRDVLSGVREGLKDITIDGATGTAFYSVNDSLGETREIWFIHDGLLYEVTTLKVLDTWLTPVLESWKFI